MRYWFSYILFLFLSIPLQSQVTVLAQLDSNTIFIGDQVNLELIVNHRRGIKMLAADLAPLTKSDTIEIVKTTGKMDTVHTGPEMVLQQSVVITSFQLGQHIIPSIKIPYQINGQNRVARTRAIPLVVMPPPTTTLGQPELAPIKPIVKEPLRLQDFLPYLLGILALVALVSVIFYFLNRGKNVEPEPEPEVWIPAHETAFDKLQSLKSKELWQNGEVKAYQSELTHIIREYLENRFEINALEMTSDDIVYHLKKKTNVSDPQQSKLKDILQIADLVKFAKANPPVNINEQFWGDAKAFVSETKTDEIPESFLEKTQATSATAVAGATTLVTGAGGAVVSNKEVLASRFKRLIASIIDGIFYSLFYTILFFIISFGLGIDSDSPTVAILAYVFILSLSFLIFWFVYGYLNANHRQPPGKKLFGIVVTDKEGGPLPMSKASMRCLVFFMENLLLGLPLLYLLFNKQKQALHDKAVGSIVINKNFKKDADLLDV